MAQPSRYVRVASRLRREGEYIFVASRLCREGGEDSLLRTMPSCLRSAPIWNR